MFLFVWGGVDLRTLRASMRGLGLALVIGVVAGPAAADCASILKFEKNAGIRIEDLARIGTDESKKAGDNYYVTVASFNADERPERDGWRALAIVLAGEYGTAIQELGGILWTTRSHQFGDRPLRLEATAQEARAVAAPSAPLKACSEGFAIEVNAEGDVTLNGARWGRVGP
jgi:hypothetical protein